ncbi:MAG: YqgE/AlgH family protein [Gammaproteobacteria bacterium]|nr:YqgE/AlgH family protein [Gammaproteobacteria bacterium]
MIGQFPFSSARSRAARLVCGALVALAAAAVLAVAAASASVPSAPRPLPEHEPARGMFLIASRELADPNFAETVVLLLEYDSSGALGLIINRPTEVRLARLLPDVEELANREDVVYEGGPVARRQVLLLLRSRAQPPDASRIFADTYVSSSLDTLRSLATGTLAGASFHAFVGYAGWAPGQLDGEVARGDWHVVPADESAVFDRDAGDVWPQLIKDNAGQWVRDTRAPRRIASARP